MYPLLDQSILTKPSLPQSVFLKCMKPTSIHTPHTPLVQLSVVSHSHKLYFFVFPSLSLSLSLSLPHTHTHTHRVLTAVTGRGRKESSARSEQLKHDLHLLRSLM